MNPTYQAINAPIVVARASNMTSGCWETASTTWADLVQQMSIPYQHEDWCFNLASHQGEKGRKFLKGLIPVLFGGGLKSGRKMNDQVTCRSLAFIDNDGGHTADDIRERLSGYESFEWPTFSDGLTETEVSCDKYLKFLKERSCEDIFEEHMLADYLVQKKRLPREAVKHLCNSNKEFAFAEGGNLRIEHLPVERNRFAILLARTFIVEAHDPRTWERANLAFFKKHGLKLDESCAELSRGFYCPAYTWDGRAPLVRHHQGKPLDLDAIIAELPQQEEARTSNKQKSARRGPAKGLPAYWKEVLDAIPNGDRQTRLLVGMALHHATGGSDDGMDTWSSWASSAWNNPEEHEAEWRRFSSDRDDGVTWSTVEYLARQGGWRRVTASYADRWGVINIKGKAMFIDMEQPDIAQALMDERSFLLMHKGDYTTSPDGKKTFYRAKEFVDRRPAETKVFENGLCFKPAGDCPIGAFNLYKGMRVTPSPDGSCELFKSLIREVWAAGDEDLHAWILEYLMHMLARPGERVRTSIPIRGDGREGKSFVFKLLGKILGDMILRVTDPNQVIGQFNESVCGKLAIVLEEAAFVGDKKLFDRLKDQVTGETSHVNPKNKPAFTTDNYARVFITSNHVHFLHMADDAAKERYTVLEASNAWKGQTTLFDAVEEEWENGGAERFLWEALHHEFRVVPGTKTLLINKTIVTEHAEMQQDLSRDHVQDLVAQHVGRLIRGFIPSAELMKCVGAGVRDRGASGSIATEMRRLGWKATKRQRGTVRGYEKGTGGSEFKWGYDSCSFLPLNVPTFFEEERRKRRAEDTEDTEAESPSSPLTH